MKFDEIKNLLEKTNNEHKKKFGYDNPFEVFQLNVIKAMEQLEKDLKKENMDKM